MKQRKIGDVIQTACGRDESGNWYWTVFPEGFGGVGFSEIHGPFKTEREMLRHQEITLLGPDCEVKPGGIWDPAWERPQ
jgi:hypothetical protein